jgi:hypothetical protein
MKSRRLIRSPFQTEIEDPSKLRRVPTRNPRWLIPKYADWEPIQDDMYRYTETALAKLERLSVAAENQPRNRPSRLE